MNGERSLASRQTKSKELITMQLEMIRVKKIEEFKDSNQ